MIFKGIIGRSRHLALVAICLFFIFPLPCAGGEIDGKPDIDNKIHGYYLWRKGDEIHIRTISVGVLHSYSGRITVTSGTFKDIETASKKMDEDDVKLSDPHTIVYSYKTKENEFGFDFKVDGHYPCIKFDLKIDRQRKIRKVYLGEHKLRPRKLPYTLFR
jgi:hypothetical protein